ncbi:MAG: HupE/UreJ family protein [Planctomycetales bacterium]
MNSLRRFQIVLSAALLLTILSHRVSAHEGDPMGGFLSGFTHPIFGLDHVLAMVAVGLWGAQLGVPAVWLLPVAFPLVMAIGGFLGLIGVPIPGVEIGVAASAVVLGAMVFRQARPKLPVALLLVALFAIFHGYAHGTELPAGESGLLYSIGFVVGTGLLHGCGILLGAIHRWNWGKRCIQGAGLLIAAGGCYFLFEALT